jgi:radical SAM protein with 4Fe4S-binding SPASM domain
MKFLYLLVDLAILSLLWLDKHLLSLRVSRTGYDNPRVRNMVGSLRYSSHAYHLTFPNIHKWLKHKTGLFPMVIQVQTINRCNATCEFCPYPYTIHLQEKRIMDDALYTKIVDECAAEKDLHDFVPMSKNEPLLDVKMEQRVAEFKAKAQPHQMVELVTNGSALTPARAQRLMDAGVDLITISVNASNEETYKRVMVGLSWKQVMSNLEALSKMELSRVNVYLRFVADQTNKRELKVFRNHWKHFNLFQFNVNNRAGTVRNYEMMAMKYNDFISRLRRVAGSRVYPVCPYVFSLVHVLENGDVPMCSNDWKNREVLGNVNTQTIREIYNSPRMNHIRGLMHEGKFEEIEACCECSFYHDWMKSPLAPNKVDRQVKLQETPEGAGQAHLTEAD